MQRNAWRLVWLGGDLIAVGGRGEDRMGARDQTAKSAERIVWVGAGLWYQIRLIRFSLAFGRAERDYILLCEISRDKAKFHTTLSRILVFAL